MKNATKLYSKYISQEIKRKEIRRKFPKALVQLSVMGLTNILPAVDNGAKTV